MWIFEISTKGEDSRTAKLTHQQVALIRKKHAEGQSQRSLAKEFNVSVGTINRIVRYQGWKE